MWTEAAIREAAMRAPMHGALRRPDTRIIERPRWYQLVTPSSPGSGLNEVVWSEVAADEAERVIDEVTAGYHATGHPVKWCVGPWTRPDGFGALLDRRGFTSWGVRGMAVDTSRDLGVPTGLEIDEVGPDDLPAFVAVALRGWSIPAPQAAAELATHRAALDRGARFFAARLDGAIAGTAGLVLRGDHAYLLAAQVLEQHRGRGLYRALVAARLAFLAKRGIGLAVTQAREATSAPILERLGFTTVFRSACYLLPPPPR